MWKHGALAALPLVLSIASPNTLRAQTTFRTIGSDFGYAVGDMWTVMTSPFHASARDWAGVGAVAGGTLLIALFDDEIDEWMLDHPSSTVLQAIKPFREGRSNPSKDLPFRDLSTARRLIPISGALWITGLAFDSKRLREAGMGCMSIWPVNSGVRYLAYAGLSRRRPGTANGDPYDIEFRRGSEWEERSVIGGHAANITACVSMLGNRFDMGVAEPALYALALGISTARMADRRHWGSDTALGMALGWAVGKAMADRYEQRDRKRDERNEMSAAERGQFTTWFDGRAVNVGWRTEF